MSLHSDNNSSFQTDLPSRMKEYEKQTEKLLSRDLPLLIRIDGHSFSQFTKVWKKPFDERLHEVMVSTTIDLVLEFGACTGFTQSDEITLIFPGCQTEKQTLPFSGRTTKLGSLTAAFSSVRFYHHLLELIHQNKIDPEKEKTLSEKILLGRAYFDARVFNLPSEEEVVNNLFWRSSMDGRRNSVAGLGQAHFSHKQLEGLSNTEIIQKLAAKGIDWNEMAPGFKYGTVIKRELFLKDSFNPKCNQTVRAVRNKPTTKAFELTLKNIQEFALKGFWNEEQELYVESQPFETETETS